MISVIIFILIFVQNIQGTELDKQKDNFVNNSAEFEVVAKVGNIEITKEEFIFNYEFGPSFTKKIKNSKEKHLKYMLYEKLFALEGGSIGLDTTRQVKKHLYSIYSDLATEELYNDEVISKVKILDKEVDSVVVRKSIDVKVKWLFAESEFEINHLYSKLKNEISFDTLFYQRYDTELKISDRELKTTRYLLGKKNHDLGKIVDTLESKKFSEPIFVENGWYIIYLDSFNQNPILSETEFTRLKTEATNVMKKRKMDSISDQYINNLMLKNEPTINSAAFRVLRSYLSNFILEKELYDKWSLSKKMDEAISALGNPNKSDISNLSLVDLKLSKVSVSQFLEWFWLRDQYLKFNKSSLESYSISLRDIVFRMIRDNLLTEEAKREGYFELEIVKKQSSWWREKVLSSAYKNYLKATININSDEVRIEKNNSQNETLNFEKEYNSKLFRTIQNLKEKYLITINNEVLNSISFSDEENPNTISLYTIKKGGLIPRTPYPTIDGDWANWE